MEGTFGLLQDVFNYELACAERYRRFVSLVMVTAGSPDGGARHVLADKIRSSDLLAEKNSHLVILMSETDGNGAQIAINRYKTQASTQPLCFSLVTFPHDTGNADDLMEAGERRLRQASEQGPGAIVGADASHS